MNAHDDKVDPHSGSLVCLCLIKNEGLICHIFPASRREEEYKSVVKELIEKEQSLNDEIRERDSSNEQLRQQLGYHFCLSGELLWIDMLLQ